MSPKSIGPYTGVTHDRTKTYPNGRTLRLLAYEAYNANGLIGSEYNGVAILDEDRLTVICDNIGVKRGIVARDPQIFSSMSSDEVFQAVVDMEWDELALIVANSDRARVLLSEGQPASPRPLEPKEMPDVFFTDVHANKEEFGHRSMEFLRHLAKALKLPEGSYSVRYNPGGPAVSGEATLHADKVYIQIGQEFSSPQAQIMYRSCKSTEDFTGGQNCYIPSGRLSELSTPEIAREISQRLGLEKKPGMSLG